MDDGLFAPLTLPSPQGEGICGDPVAKATGNNQVKSSEPRIIPY